MTGLFIDAARHSTSLFEMVLWQWDGAAATMQLVSGQVYILTATQTWALTEQCPQLDSQAVDHLFRNQWMKYH